MSATDDPPDERLWALSFRVSHPSADLADLADRIGDAFDMDPEVLWQAGDLRPHAMPPRRHTSSYCSVSWDNQGGTITRALEDALDALAPLAADLAAIRAGGGTLGFFVGLFFQRTMGVELPSALLARMGAAGIELLLDLYGGDWGENST